MAEMLSVVSRREVPPDESITEAIGRHHRLETALADLVDNSVDADATRVHIRFMTGSSRLVSLRVIDDGTGMTTEVADAAMAYARKREYGDSALGHFGLGLKAASLSQADVLDVYTVTTSGDVSGRRIQAASRTTIEELDEAGVSTVLGGHAAQFPGARLQHGTIIQWGEVRSTISNDDEAEHRAWLEKAIDGTRSHLGLVFHRLLERGELTLTIDEFDLDVEFPGATRSVEAIDPFDYPGAASTAWNFTVRSTAGTLSMAAHCWPHQYASDAGYKLPGFPEEARHGFFVYRHDRLLQIGGWNAVTNASRELAYARVVLDVTDAHRGDVTINPEKDGVELSAALRDSIARAVDSQGRTFRQFLDYARGAGQESRKRTASPIVMDRVSRGLNPDVTEAISRATEPDSGQDFEIRWSAQFAPSPVHVDLENRTLWLNLEMKDVLGADGTSANAATLVKTLVLMTYARYFGGSYLGHKQKRELAAWNEVLTAAVEAERARRHD